MTSDMLSQEEIDSLLGGSKDEPELEFFEDELEDKTKLLSEMEIDALGEIGNISMGTAATTLSTLLNKKVNITTPRVTITTAEELADEYKIPFVAVDVSYSAGLEGSNVLILKTDDVKIITDLMMGKDEIDSSRELTELDLSAAGEAMNQMMGSSSTSLSEMFMKKIDIAPPKSLEITFSDGKNEIDLLSSDSPLIKISFKMVIGDFIDSNIMQLIPLQFGKDMVDNLLNPTDVSKKTEEVTKIVEQPQEISEPRKTTTQSVENTQREPVVARTENMDYNNTGSIEQERVVVKKPEFQNFDIANTTIYNEQIDIVGDIPVEITVELGRTNKKINEILEFGPGTVVELDKLVGEALNIYANGKFIAKGEVVVIDDNFGIRVTEIEKNNTKII